VERVWDRVVVSLCGVFVVCQIRVWQVGKLKVELS